MAFRRRDYPEVLDGMLTALIGGVAAEPHPYPPPAGGEPPRHLLEAPPARRLVSVYGARNGLSFRFKADADFEMASDGTALVWRKGGARPDAGTLIEVNYLKRDTAALLTDLEVGSVTRTLVESMAREVARLQAQLEAVQDAGFVDSASGGALDKVVSLLGVQRIPADRATATLRFDRAEGAPGAITIPGGTRVIDAAVQVEYETVAEITLAPGQPRIQVEARDVEPGNAPVAADLLTVLAVPIAGIARVTNPAPARRGSAAETDAALRARAQGALTGGERATLGALRAALARQLVQGEVTEPADRPGVVVVTPVTEGLTPERQEQLLAALEDARPAGIRLEVTGAAVPAAVEIDLGLVTRAGLAPTAIAAAHEAVRRAIEEFFAALPIRSDASINQIVGRVLRVEGVEDVSILAAQKRLATGAAVDVLDAAGGRLSLADQPVVLRALSISDPALPTRADLVIRFPAAAAAPDRNAVVAALEAAFAYLAGVAADPATDGTPARIVSYGKLLAILPAPVGQGLDLAGYDGAAPLPGDAGDYDVSLFIAQANGLTQILATPADSYELSGGERLVVGQASLEPEE
ncbi:hypothetical protein BKE38_02790 [Pseudoroseomonas deserti]|uniref:Baseplate protein J-like barrel domain-containing protein n=1 Tax=Teichococcus deserti TaxID=1817963 RepID=A0A1V2H9P2_9PROT|nr:baseplate J/gp47 family protein [Pseudoroseomonas deserti]ONG58585.1 hypothetical protein BKE38_02790 [Pseudoroseomonas deserti]